MPDLEREFFNYPFVNNIEKFYSAIGRYRNVADLNPVHHNLH